MHGDGLAWKSALPAGICVLAGSIIDCDRFGKWQARRSFARVPEWGMVFLFKERGTGCKART